MIWLIDDNENNLRQRNYTVEYIDTGEYSDIIKTTERVLTGDDLAFLHEASAILVHTSIPWTDTQGQKVRQLESIADKVLREVSRFGKVIPSVFFSGNPSAPKFHTSTGHSCITAMDKGLFYAHLRPFLDAFRRDLLPDLRILAYGPNYIHRQLEAAAEPILAAIRSLKPDDLIAPQSIPGQALHLFFTLADTGTDPAEIIRLLHKKPPYKSRFETRIYQLLDSFAQHGKNIFRKDS